MWQQILKRKTWLFPLLFVIAFTPISSWIDLLIASYTFYHKWQPSPEQRGFFSTPLFDFVYLWFVVPAQILSFSAMLILILSIWFEPLKKLRSLCFVLSFTFIVGSGVVSHFMLKEHWGRPRPRQITEFGGKQPFRPYYVPFFGKKTELLKSFPSGHSTCGFYFFCLYFIFRRLNKPTLARLGCFLGLFFGGMLSAARIVQGGHFISDILFSALIMWYAAYFVDWLAFEARFLSRLRSYVLNDDDLLASNQTGLLQHSL